MLVRLLVEQIAIIELSQMIVSPIQRKSRKIGTLEGIASFSEIDHGKITMEEFLGLQEVKNWSTC